jgi:hypothetical protein
LTHVTLFFAGKAGEDLGQVLLWVNVQQGSTFGEGEDEGRISSRSLTADVLTVLKIQLHWLHPLFIEIVRT